MAVLAALTAGALASPSGASGAGAEYTVLQCHPLNRGHQADLADSNAYTVHAFCADARQDNAIKASNVRAAGASRSGRARWSVPDRAALGIVGAKVGAKLRNAAGHRAQVFVLDRSGRELRRIAGGGSGPAGFSQRSASFPRAASVVARLQCQRSGGCPQSNLAKAWVRNVGLTIADYVDPGFVRLGGTLRDPGWLRGAHGLDVVATDRGSGLERIVATVNGTTLAKADGSCGGRIGGSARAARFVPCGSSGELRVNPSTTEAPFRDGENSVSVCAVDFAGNETCDERTVAVDNAPPALPFTDALDPDDQELIRAEATDPHSGVDTGRIRTGRTNRNGVNRHTYRFRMVVGKVRFRFRAQVPRQRGYPYVRGASKPRWIVVSG